MMEWKNVNIVAYLYPHPLDEDYDTEQEMVSWIPGFVNEPTEDQDNPIYTDANLELYNKIELDVKEAFQKGLKSMWPLCKDIHMKQMNVMIDLVFISGKKKGIAGYRYGESDPMKGIYQFDMSPKLLVDYINNLKVKANIWEHELIHLLDHMEITRSSVYAECNSRTNNLRHFILKFREEGIADLYYLLKGNHPDIHSIEEAKEMFREKVKCAGLKCKEAVRSDETFRQELYSGYHFYEAGPWLILDALQKMGADMFDNLIVECLAAFKGGKEIAEDKILQVVKMALGHMDCRKFLSYAEEVMKEKVVTVENMGNGVSE